MMPEHHRRTRQLRVPLRQHRAGMLVSNPPSPHLRAPRPPGARPATHTPPCPRRAPRPDTPPTPRPRKPPRNAAPTQPNHASGPPACAAPPRHHSGYAHTTHPPLHPLLPHQTHGTLQPRPRPYPPPRTPARHRPESAPPKCLDRTGNTEPRSRYILADLAATTSPASEPKPAEASKTRRHNRCNSPINDRPRTTARRPLPPGHRRGAHCDPRSPRGRPPGRAGLRSRSCRRRCDPRWPRRATASRAGPDSARGGDGGVAILGRPGGQPPGCSRRPERTRCGRCDPRSSRRATASDG